MILMAISNKIGQDTADHRQQERDGGGLRDPVRRHGRWLRADQGRAQDAGLPAGRVPKPRRAGDPAAGADRPPSAELRPDQKDQDSLPPYEVLDPILELYIEEDRSVEDIIAAAIPRPRSLRVARLVDRNEYKRRQAPPGVHIAPTRLRPRPALSHHLRVWIVGISRGETD